MGLGRACAGASAMFPRRRDREVSSLVLVGIGTAALRGSDMEWAGNQEAMVGNRLIVVAKSALNSDRTDATKAGELPHSRVLKSYNSHCMKLEPTFVNSNACSPK